MAGEPLADMVQQTQPLLLIFDPLRNGHDCNENNSGEMKSVMGWLRSYATADTGILIVHHVARTVDSYSRGSTAIRGSVDIAVLQERDPQTDLVTLWVMKNRFGECRTLAVKPDFLRGEFELVDNPQAAKETEELKKIQKIIANNPGISKNQIYETVGMGSARLFDLLSKYMDVL